MFEICKISQDILFKVYNTLFVVDQFVRRMRGLDVTPLTWHVVFVGILWVKGDGLCVLGMSESSAFLVSH